MPDTPKLPDSPMSGAEPSTEWKWWRLRAIGVTGVLLLCYGFQVWAHTRWMRHTRSVDIPEVLPALLNRAYILLLALVLARLIWRGHKAWRAIAVGLKVVAAAYLIHCFVRGAAQGYDAVWAIIEIPRACGALILVGLPSTVPARAHRLWQSLAAGLFGLGVACAGIIRVVEVQGSSAMTIVAAIPAVAAVPYVAAVMLVVATVHLVLTKPRADEDEGAGPGLREQVGEVTAWLRRRIAEVFS